MATAAFDVTGIGNAIVDVIAHADDAFLAANAVEKGAMTLIDTARAEDLYGRMGPGVEMSGGSAGNTMAGVAMLGGKGAYIGKVAKDQLGDVFGHDIRASGVRFDTAPLVGGASTARCLILVTPDAQRSMNTYLGACVELGPEDIDEELIAASQVTYLEGYLWDPPARRRRSARPPPSRTPPGARCRCRCRTASAFTATTPNSWIWWKTTSTSCSPTSMKSARSMEPTVLKTRSPPSSGWARSRR